MTRKESYAALGLQEGADLAEVKRAYRKLAFSLHPDLNPNVPDAAKRFQRLNEAYVMLSQAGSGPSRPFWGSAKKEADEASARAREDAKKAYSKARQGQEFSYSSAKEAQAEHDKEDVLKDILNDPFARRVFEDIYSHIRQESRANSSSPHPHEEARSASFGAKAAPIKKSKKIKAAETVPPADGVVGKLKGWLRKQIDDEQVLRLPGESLIPGARVRLQIQHGLTGETQTVELTLPPEFIPGKAMRLKGLGKHLCSWKGDLYVRIIPE